MHLCWGFRGELNGKLIWGIKLEAVRTSDPQKVHGTVRYELLCMGLFCFVFLHQDKLIVSFHFHELFEVPTNVSMRACVDSGVRSHWWGRGQEMESRAWFASVPDRSQVRQLPGPGCARLWNAGDSISLLGPCERAGGAQLGAGVLWSRGEGVPGLRGVGVTGRPRSDTRPAYD